MERMGRRSFFFSFLLSLFDRCDFNERERYSALGWAGVRVGSIEEIRFFRVLMVLLKLWNRFMDVRSVT